VIRPHVTRSGALLAAASSCACSGAVPDADLSGVVLEAGAPVADVAVRLRLLGRTVRPGAPGDSAVAEPLAARSDDRGRFRFELAADQAAWLAVSAAAAPPDSVPVLTVGGESVAVTIELQGADERGRARAPIVRFEDPESGPARLAAAYERIVAYPPPAGLAPTGAASATAGPAGLPEGLPANPVDETDPLVRRFLAVEALSAADAGADLEIGAARTALIDLPPTWPGWSFFPARIGLMKRAFEVGRGHEGRPMRIDRNPGLLEHYIGYMDVAASGHATREVRAAAMFFAMRAAYAADLDGMAESYLQRLVGWFPDTDWAARARRVPRLDSRIAPGLKIAGFELVSLDSTAVYSAATLAGSVYLIDFWATWCGPCIKEMENLHAVWERFRDRGYQVLSVNVGESREAVDAFRRDAWPMPWLHAWIGVDSEEMKHFEIPGLPRTILVDRDGTILDARLGVMGEDLERGVEMALEENPRDTGR